jgi:hypothetical protein
MVLTKEGRGPAIDAADIVATVRRGEVVVVPGAMRRIGLHGQLVDMALSAIRDACGAAEAEALGCRGLEKLHEVLDGAQIERAAHEIDQRLSRWSPRLMKELGRQALGLKRPFYIPLIAITRLSVPNGTHQRGLTLETSPMLLNRLPPHRDSWFTSPVNSLNVWIAIGAVEHENGLCVYTDMWGKAVTRDERDGRDFGTPLTFALEAGDVAIFDNRQLHASAANVGSSTRIVLSARICPELPVAPRASELEAVALWSPFVGTRLEHFAGAATKLSWVYAIERLKRRMTSAVIAVERRIGGVPLRALRRALRYRRADLASDRDEQELGAGNDRSYG